MKVLRVVPPPAKPGQAVTAQGTQVLGADGQQLPGVTKVELVVETGGLWMARIHCLVAVEGEIVAEVMPPDALPPALKRIETKLDALLSALTEEDEAETAPAVSLDGDQIGRERNPWEPL